MSADRFDSDFRAREFEHGQKGGRLDPRAWADWERHKMAMVERDLADLDPGPWVSALVAGGQAAALVGVSEGVRVEMHNSSELPPTIGRVGPAVEIASQACFLSGTVVLPVDHRRSGRVPLETLRLFRFEPGLGRYTIVGFSGLGWGGDCVWGRISSPGWYLAIGLDADPVMLRLGQALYAVRDLFAGCDPKARRQITRGIVEAVLLSPGTTSWVEDSALRAHFGRRASANGLPSLPFDQQVTPASVDELFELADSVADQLDPPPLQLLACLLAAARQP